MRITLTWINLFSITLVVVVGAVTSTTEKLYIYDGKLSELNDTLDADSDADNQKITINDNNLNSDNADGRISRDFYTSNDDIRADLDDNQNIKINEKTSEQLSAARQSNKHQPQSLNNDESHKGSKKRKSSPKTKKKKKRRRTKQQKLEMNQHRHRDEESNPGSDKTNYSAASHNLSSNQFQSLLESDNGARSQSNKSTIVMEMVEAIIDNNYDVNLQQTNRHDRRDSNAMQKTSARDDESNSETTMPSTTTRLREPFKAQMSRRSDERRQRKLHAKDPSPASNDTASSDSETNRPKINKRLKRKRKYMTGDLSCMKGGFIPAPRVANANIKYIRNEMLGIEKSFLEAEYHCHDGYKLIKKVKRKASIKNENVVCKKRRWFGQRPLCKEIKSTVQQCEPHEADRCEQLCIKHADASEAECYCHKGFRLIGTRCLDIDECDEQGTDICGSGKCVNSLGSFECRCQRGFKLNSAGKCVDMNECFLRGGHGPCQDECANTIGGYECSCGRLKGTHLAKDGHSCEDSDLCAFNNGGCSHTCLDTIGQTFCSCPDGYTLDSDWKTCIDIDECQLQETMKSEQRCNFDCINLVGSFKCVDSSEMGADQPASNDDFDDYATKNDLTDSYDAEGNYDIIEGGSYVSECSNGYYFNETIGDCQDINECEIDNGNCSNGTCVNTNGSFYCSCHKGFVMSDDDRYKCIPQQKSPTESSEALLGLSNVACPPLFPPLHGYLECSRPIENSTVTTAGRLKITNRPGSQCVLQCPTSYRASGTFIKTCGEDGNWHGDDDGICIKYPTPKLICPPNSIVELPPFSDEVEVKLQRPKTDLNIKRDVTIKPLWIKGDRIALKKGEMNLTYTARHPISKLTTSCTSIIYVVDGEPPLVDFCPPTQKYKIEKYHDSIKAFWVEPKFSDNVKVVDVTKTNEPGSPFGLGSHQIVYEAKDAAGYTNRCTFKVIVNAPKREGLKLPIENRNKFYI